MTRRLPLALLVLAVPALAGCATFSNVDRVATVNGVDITRAEFEAMSQDFFAHPDLFGAAAPVDGHVDAGAARDLIAITAQARLIRELVGDDELDAAADAALEGLAADDPVRDMTPEMQTLFAEITSRQGLLATVPAPDAAELEQGYTESPASVGVLCVRHILVETEAEADDVAAQLADGADFAELAAEVSRDTGSGASGGVVPSPSGGACWTLSDALGGAGLVPEFVHNARPLAAGETSAPFATDFGWHIVQQLPWSDVADSVVAAHAPGVTGDVQYVAALLGADVDVDPTFGVWDSGTASIVPLG